MARKAKTKMGGKVDTAAMLRAGQAQEKVSQAEMQGAAQAERGAAVTRQTAAGADKAIQYDVEQRKEQGRYEAKEAQQAEQMQFQQGMAERQQGLKEEEFQAGLADKGLQPKSQGEERAGAVEQEMEKGAGQPALMGPPTPDQQRMAEQGEKPLEMPTARGGFQGGYEFTEGRKAEAATKQETARISKATALMKAQTAHQKAYYEQNKEGMEEAETELKQPIKDVNAKIERLIRAMHDTRYIESVNWKGLAEDFKGYPQVLAEIEAQGQGAGVGNLMRALRNQMAKKGLEYFAATGKNPGDELWDPTTMLGRQLAAEVEMEGGLMLKLGGGGDVRTLAEKNRKLQRRAAGMMLLALTQEEADRAAKASGEILEEEPLAPTMGIPEGPPSPVYDPEWKETTTRELPSGRGKQVRTTSPREQQRAEQITGDTSGVPAPGTPGAPKESLRSKWERERGERRGERGRKTSK